MASNQVLGSDKIVRIGDEALLGMVQSVEWSPNFNAQDINELGRVNRVATAMELEVSGTMEVQSIGGLPGLLARTMVARTSGDFTGYMYASGGSGGKNLYTITESSFADCQFDLTLHERTDQLTFDRSTVLPRLFVNSVAGRADANGQATETLSFAGDFVVGCPAPKYHDVRVVPAMWATNNTLSIPAAYSATNYSLLYLYIDECRYQSAGAAPNTTAAGFATTVITLPTGIANTLVKTSVNRAILYKTATQSTTFPSLVDGDRTTVAYFQRGWQIDIYVEATDDNAPTADKRFLKVQSLDWNIDLKNEALRQIAYNSAGSSVYYRAPTFPIDVTVNASMTETDWNDWRTMLDPTLKPFNNTNAYESTYDFAPVNMKDHFHMVMEYKTKAGSVLQRLIFPDLRVDGSGHKANVGGRGEVSWSFKGTKFTLVGANPAS